MSRLRARPGWELERRALLEGSSRVAGLDEVGRGCLAGPVVVAAVILRPKARLAGLNDSKLLTPLQRETLFTKILRASEAWGIGAADAQEIDRINILNATRLAMARAVESLPVQPDHLLIDAVSLPQVLVAQTCPVGGDRISVSIAAASVVAKVVRDRVMDYYDRVFPGFGFAAHKGYGTQEHLQAVERLGPCALHRRSFQGVWLQRSIEFS
ncbi:MAG TPA: ribonuclease HII [Candidatus Polarisedimenticolia bacterium]|nr:ribonuclease HII [Candidatus Polarisedimenticolia bacterium]